MVPRIAASDLRRVFLHLQGLSDPPARRVGPGELCDLVDRLGFVQVDSINTVTRAHHQILFSRNQTYREDGLTRLLERDRALFENWTHDAAVIPSAAWPYWRHRFERSWAPRPRLRAPEPGGRRGEHQPRRPTPRSWQTASFLRIRSKSSCLSPSG